MNPRWLFLIVPGLYYLWWNHGLSHPPGVLVPETPVQSQAVMSPWQHAGFQIEALAHYRIRARLLSREPYFVDGGAKLAPIDIAVGWGPMSDQSVLDHLRWSQSYRFWHYSPRGREWPIPMEELNSHSANMHIIPADGRILTGLRWTRPGSIIRLEGYLVQAAHAGAQPWRSSLTRTDQGSGACELMWVTDFAREP